METIIMTILVTLFQLSPIVLLCFFIFSQRKFADKKEKGLLEFQFKIQNEMYANAIYTNPKRTHTISDYIEIINLLDVLSELKYPDITDAEILRLNQFRFQLKNEILISTERNQAELVLIYKQYIIKIDQIIDNYLTKITIPTCQ